MKTRCFLALAAISLPCMAAPQAVANLANAAQALAAKDFDRAREILSQALLQNPGSAQALFMMAHLDMQTDHPEEAVEYFERGLRIEPKSFPGHYELALALLREQKWNDGLRELRIAVQLDPRQPGRCLQPGAGSAADRQAPGSTQSSAASQRTRAGAAGLKLQHGARLS